MVVFV